MIEYVDPRTEACRFCLGVYLFTHDYGYDTFLLYIWRFSLGGSKAGGRKAAITNRERYGNGKDGRPDFYKEIGHAGGKVSRGGGFAKNPELASKSGRIGGKWSRKYTKEEWAEIVMEMHDSKI